ncbi:MAG: Coenzyme F420 hydrogenase/dehydrogenase, beta subunit C-terminal domain [Firmicutes bacterium]|nr:Coenzyme F420 hydrogenase/dehydrogenase, beta subunit C-terminal domain [Bacillota bacterium]
MKKMTLETNQKPAAALTSFFKYLLEEKVVDALLLPQVVESKNSVVTTLVKDPGQIRSADPFAPVSLANAARHVSDLTFKDPQGKIGVVLRPCEIRALIELVKLNQASLDQLLIIGIDCLGTFHPVDYRSLAENDSLSTDEWLKKASGGEDLSIDGVSVRSSCLICESILPEHADINIGWIGVDTGRELILEIRDDLVPAVTGAGMAEGSSPEREVLIASLREKRAAAKEKAVAVFNEKLGDMGAFMSELATCLKCQNCRKACPICFCRQCVFESMVFEHESDKYLNWATRKGLIEMPTDTVLFHLTRLNHMGTSCVGCGQCESACPSKLPLAAIFTAVGKKVQEIFDYVPGRNPEEALPLTTYKEDELEPR